jgi:hypothetical protein
VFFQKPLLIDLIDLITSKILNEINVQTQIIIRIYLIFLENQRWYDLWLEVKDQKREREREKETNYEISHAKSMTDGKWNSFRKLMSNCNNN